MTRRVLKMAVGALVALALGGGLFVGTAAAAYPPTRFPPPPAPPRNDQFVNPVVLSPNPTVFGISPIAGDIRTATAERGEPNHAGFGGSAHQSVWYQWRAPRNGIVEFNTCNSHYDTELGVYAAPPAGALPLWNGVGAVAQDDDADDFLDNPCGSTYPFYYNSVVQFPATAGTTYRIAVDGYYPAGFDNNSAFFLNYRYLVL